MLTAVAKFKRIPLNGLTYWSSNQKVKSFISQMDQLFEPDNIHLCNGTEAESLGLLDNLAESGKIIKLNMNLRPNSYLARSDPSDVARVESQTFICSHNKQDAGPTNNWMYPDKMKYILNRKMSGSMKGRTMYVMPFSMGPIGSPIAQYGLQVTDSPYVVANMRIMTRMGTEALRIIEQKNDFIPCIHTVGHPLQIGQDDVDWPCNREKYIAHFPETKTIMSYGSGYGGNALLGKKCFALRIASSIAQKQGWLAEHMLIIGVTDPNGQKKYMTAAFPSACGKTNLAMMNPTLDNWKVETIGDDIAWMKFDNHGQLRAINPEAGFFGVAPGTSVETNPNAITSCSQNSLFTNCALTDDGDVWWEGLTTNKPRHLIDWKGKDWSPSSNTLAAHPNARFTAPISQCPVKDDDWDNPSGVPISAILFGGRRESLVPLVLEAHDWTHGVYMGASVSSAQTAAAEQDKIGKLRHDPFAMLPFCGYNMGDYFNHWLNIANNNKVPKIYQVNWFRKENGKFMWPGFGDNIRVLKWIFERIDNNATATSTPVGLIPQNLDTTGLKCNKHDLDKLLHIDNNGYLQELDNIESYFNIFDKLPNKLHAKIQQIKTELNKLT